MKAYSYSILTNDGRYGGCHSSIEGYTINPVLAMIRGFEQVKKKYPNDICEKEWNFDDYHLMGERASNYANIHNRVYGTTDVSVFVKEINIEEGDKDLDKLLEKIQSEE